MLFRAGKRGRIIPRWFWYTLIGLPVGLMIWWFLCWFFTPWDERTSAVVIDAPRSEAKRLPIKKDDFRLIKGIGPKSAAALYQSGIFSFEQLGLFDLEKLEGILKANSLPVSGAAFWKKQAVLAAAEDWERLEKLQK